MAQVTETSVMFALADLQRTEILRQNEETAQEARRQREQKEREQLALQRKREEELQTQRVAEAAARLSIDLEAREVAARERVAAMQQALIQIKAERDVLHEHLQAQTAVPAVPASTAPVRWAMGGMALSMIAVAAMAIVMLSQPVRARTREIFVSPSPVSRPAAPALTQSSAIDPAPVAAGARSSAKPGPTGVHPKPARTVRLTRPQEGVSQDSADCGNDPICGMKFYK